MLEQDFAMPVQCRMMGDLLLNTNGRLLDLFRCPVWSMTETSLVKPSVFKLLFLVRSYIGGVARFSCKSQTIFIDLGTKRIFFVIFDNILYHLDSLRYQIDNVSLWR